jgi:diguanylate cyclase (GGDEF)-like protein
MAIGWCPQCGTQIFTTGSWGRDERCPSCGRALPDSRVEAQAEEVALATTETLASAQDPEDELWFLTECFGRALGARAALAVAIEASGELPVAGKGWRADAESGSGRLLQALEATFAAGRTPLTQPRLEPLAIPTRPGRPESLACAVAVPVPAEAGGAGGLFAALDGPPADREATLTLAGSFTPLGSICLRHATQTKRLEHLARHDPLTGCLSRSAILETLEAEFARSTRLGRPVSLCFFDLDDFKAINDSHGHLAGDRLLEEVGEVLAEETREYDAAGRYGGDEFLVVMPETGRRDAVGVARRLSEGLRRRSDRNGGPRLSASLGVATRGLERDAAGLLATADERLLAAKRRRAGRLRRFPVPVPQS